MNKSTTTLKIISGYYYLNALILFFLGFFFILSISITSSTYFGLAGIIAFVISVASVLIGRGLWLGKLWAKLVCMFISGISILGSLMLIALEGMIILTIIEVIVHLSIIIYLMIHFYKN